MALSLKMLPCKKRRAAAAGPHSPRERGGSGEDGEPPPPPPPPAAVSSAAGVWRTPAEALPRGGRRPPPQDGSEGRSAAEPCAEDGKRLEGGKEEEQDGEDIERRKRRRKANKRKREGKSQEEEGSLSCDIKLDDTLDRTLEDGAKQHNLTVVNVRNILHEVITNEHVVAMMKAAISETEDIPLFEPKMTRSKLKEVVEKGVVIPTWNISPIKKANEVKPPQFVDIPLEEDDSSDEEYQPDDEDEDETAEEVEKVPTPVVRHISAEVVPMGPPPPPKPKQNKDSTFMEKLHAVDEELASSPVCMDSYQPLEDSLIAFRTRSKRPLKDVPLGQLEAELRAPDITPDMYDPNTADDEEWKKWLGGLMNDDVENEDELDDDDDPEYNFLEDLDEPDTEDFRNDRAVRITKKEVNELMEELFETFQDEMGFSNMEDEGPEDEDNVTESRPNFNTPQALRFEEPLANLLNEQHRTVKEQLEQLRMKKSSIKPPQEVEKSKPQNEKPLQSLVLDCAQRKRLQQQMQQSELGNFARSSTLLRQSFYPKFQTMFQPCNLKGALQLVEDFHAQVQVDCSPRKAAKKSASDFPCLPKQVAWILATRRVFMYPELLPICSLKANPPRDKIIFTKAEDNLLALGLKHFEGTEFPKPLISKYLLPTKTAHQLTVRIKNLNMNRAPDNIIRHYKKTKQLPVLFKCCEEIQPNEWKPPVEREEHRLPFWLKASLPSIQGELKQLAEGAKEVAGSTNEESDFLGTEKETSDTECGEKYPLLMPKGLVLTLKPLANRFSRRAWRRQRSSALKPVLIRPNPCLQPTTNAVNIQKTVKLSQSEAAPGKVMVQIPQLIQPATVVQAVPGVQPLNVPAVVGSGDGLEFQNVLSASHPDSRQGFSAAVPPALVSSNPPSPVILTVPATTVKVVNIGNGCNMIQSINTAVGRGTQAIPVTTLLEERSTNPTASNADEAVKAEAEDSNDTAKEVNPVQKRNLLCAEVKEEFMLGLGQELNMEAACSSANELKEMKKEHALCEEKGEEERRALQSSPRAEPQRESVGTPAGPEAGGEKEGQEEEDDDDFDDFTQDEDEEMSSASEESILSVPELQETMEKLTWLATERRLSQEGDSEEENSQEENSEPEEEEEEEGEGIESSQKDDEVCGDVSEEPKSAFTLTNMAPQVEAHRMPPGENMKAPGKSRSSHRARNKRSRARASKDTSKLLLLYDENILERDPLREQKDLAFAQAYLTRVREALQHIPGKYEDFLRVIYEFEISMDKQTAVDLYFTLQKLLHDWPQLLTDFAAFLLPEQALECGLFEEQQAFEKSRKFLRQLEICFAENPAHHQKIIKVLQSCVDCLPQEIAELKTQMWQLLKGHDHLQDEFSVFFDHLRPSASRMGDFEEINWTEEKEYEFDGFEEVSLPDVEEEDEPPKIHAAPKNKKRKEIGGQHNDKVCENKFYKNKDSQELSASLVQQESSPQPEGKDPGTSKEAVEENLDNREEGEDVQSRTKTASRKGDPLPAGSHPEGRAACSRHASPEKAALPEGQVQEGGVSAAVHRHSEELEYRVHTASLGQKEEEQQQQRVTEATVCAKNSKVSSTGEKVVLWTREADRVILTTCQEKGAHLETFQAISQKLGNKTAAEVSHRFRELMKLFHTSCDGSSEDEEDATSTSNADQLSDKDLLLSEEEPDD
ncbi:UNVERIFIED_CONTAM: hypothetical protein H355_010744 [Colinus virginianus]|nr:hypothetical protein H355_010744 [Colinus virginianus]